MVQIPPPPAQAPFFSTQIASIGHAKSSIPFFPLSVIQVVMLTTFALAQKLVG